MSRTMLLYVGAAATAALLLTAGYAAGWFFPHATHAADPNPGAAFRHTADSSLPSSTEDALAAYRRASENDRYLLAFCWNANDSATVLAREAFEAAAAASVDRADACSVHLSDPRQAAFVKEFDLSRAPTPLVLVIAPNGAVTLGELGAVTESQVREAFLSPAAAASLGAFQKGRLVLVCCRRAGELTNQEVDAGVAAFQADQAYGPATEVVRVNIADPDEADFLAELDVAPTSTEPVTALLAPPAGLLAKFIGTVTPEELKTALNTAGTCGPNGCGPGGCCPGGVCPPAPAK